LNYTKSIPFLFDNYLSLADERNDNQSSRLNNFNNFLLFHVTFRSWMMYLDNQGRYSIIDFFCPLILTFLFTVFKKNGHKCTILAFLVYLIKFSSVFPTSPNHYYVELYFLFLFSIFNFRNSKNETNYLTNSLKLLFVIILFYTGIKKLLYGQYFRGEYLAYLISCDERFSSVFSYILSKKEMLSIKSGNYITGNYYFYLISNSIYLFEIIAPIILFFKKDHNYIKEMLIIFFITLFLISREFTFAAIFLQPFYLFFNTELEKVFNRVFMLIYILMLLPFISIIPMWTFN
jgi:hypothetical protein